MGRFDFLHEPKVTSPLADRKAAATAPVVKPVKTAKPDKTVKANAPPDKAATDKTSSTPAPKTNAEIDATKKPIEPKVVFKPNKLNSIYSFRYDVPLTDIKVWDRAPLVVVIFEDHQDLMGINLHWLPPNLIPVFVKYCSSMLKMQMGQMVLRIVYEALKYSGYKSMLFALRKYKKNRMKNVIPIDVMLIRTNPKDLFKYRPILAKRM
jgi:hypothetical protein